MNQSEKRRKELLNHARNLYGGQRQLPAVHPRYKAAYSEIYSDKESNTGETFGIRFMICLLLFAVFAAMDYRDVEVANVSSSQIVKEIKYQPDVAEVWKNL